MTVADAASDRTFVRRVLIFLLLVGIAAALWIASHALILLFGAIVFAVILRGLAGLLRQVAPIPDKASVATVIILIIVVLIGSGWLFGNQISSQFDQVAQRLPDSLSQVEQWLRDRGWGRQVLDLFGGTMQGGGGQSGAPTSGEAGAASRPGGGGNAGSTLVDGVGWLVQRAGTWLMAIFNALAEMVLVLFGAVFLAFQPSLYRAGIEKLAPRDRTEQVDKALDRSGRALWLWAAGAMAEMFIVGVITGVGLWLMGVPAPLALGLIAGLLEFVPFVGPILAAIPGILLAATVSPSLALWTALFYLVLQQVEGNLILPLVQRKAVALPPVVAIFAILVFGSLFGVIGVLFAVPLAVALMTLVQVLYVRDTLRKPVQVEGS